MSEDDAAIRQAFGEFVNMTPAALDRWLGTEDSRSVGQTRPGEDEAVGHQSGRRIAELLRQRGAPDADDLAFMRKVVGYIRRHGAQRPDGDVAHTRWRYSLMNWGHDPLR